MAEDGFYTVWNPKTGYTMRRHAAYELAKNQAEQLAHAHPGDRFYVFSALSYSEKPRTPSITHRLNTTDDIPLAKDTPQ